MKEFQVAYSSWFNMWNRIHCGIQCCKRSCLLRKFICELGVVSLVEGLVLLYCDSTCVIAQTKEPKFYKRIKYILRRYHLIRKIIDRGDIEPLKIDEKKNLIDSFTKTLETKEFDDYKCKKGITNKPMVAKSLWRCNIICQKMQPILTNHKLQKWDRMPLTRNLASQPFERCGIDFMEPISPASRLLLWDPSQYIIMAMDYFTKWAEARAIQKLEVRSTTKFLYERAISRFGCPLELVSNRGSHFLNEVIL